MRVLLVSDLPPWARGGLERHVGDLAVELRRRGIPTMVVACGERRETRGGVITRPPALSLLSGAYRDSARPFHPPWPDPEIVALIVAAGRRWAPDVIHAHGWSAASAAFAALWLRIPVVVTLHDYGLICPTRTMRSLGPKACPGPHSRAHGRCATELMGRPKSEALNASLLLYRRLMKSVSLIAVSESVRLASQTALHREPVLIPNFVRDDLFSDTPEPRNEVPRVLFMGGANPVKGLDVLERAMAGSSAQLIVAGTRPKLRRSETIYVGSVDHGEVAALIDQSNVVVVPSVWEEPCPTVVIEAMARSRAVVASSVGGITEMLRHGAGHLVKGGDASDLRSGIDELINSQSLRSQVSERARDRALSEYSASAVVPRIIEAYVAAKR